MHKFKVGEKVLRRLRHKGGIVTAQSEKRQFVKESDKDFNISKTVYVVTRIDPTFPLPSYVISQLDGGVTVPGRFIGTDLIPYTK